MNVPTPDVREYAKLTVAVLLALAVFQYTGVFAGNAGAIDWNFLLGVGVLLPIFTYVLALIADNVAWLPDIDRMARPGK